MTPYSLLAVSGINPLASAPLFTPQFIFLFTESPRYRDSNPVPWFELRFYKEVLSAGDPDLDSALRIQTGDGRKSVTSAVDGITSGSTSKINMVAIEDGDWFLENAGFRKQLQREFYRYILPVSEVENLWLTPQLLADVYYATTSDTPEIKIDNPNAGNIKQFLKPVTDIEALIRQVCLEDE